MQYHTKSRTSITNAISANTVCRARKYVMTTSLPATGVQSNTDSTNHVRGVRAGMKNDPNTSSGVRDLAHCTPKSAVVMCSLCTHLAIEEQLCQVTVPRPFAQELHAHV